MSATFPASKQLAAFVFDVEKSYGDVAALRGVDLAVRPGEVVALLGPNGAGKTTLLRILATLTRPDAGTVNVCGYDAASQGELVRQHTGALLHSPMLYADLTARENLRFYASIFRIQDPDGRVAEVAGRLGLTERLDDRVRTLSHGLAKRFGLCRALLHRPRLLLLDEPETGLDQGALRLLDDVLAEYRQDGRSAVVSTHSVDRGLAWADRVAVLARGRVVLDRPRAEVNEQELRAALGGPVPTFSR